MNFLSGDNKCEGQIQLLYDGQWGLMCGDSLGMQEASVICRQLGCGSVNSISQYILTPEEMKQPWLSSVQCHGEEATLWECLLGSWGPLSGCNCQCVAVIICSGKLDGDSVLLSPLNFFLCLSHGSIEANVQGRVWPGMNTSYAWILRLLGSQLL